MQRSVTTTQRASQRRDTPLVPSIISLFGLYARYEQGWLSVASMIRLMGDLGIEHQAVRSAISRLKRRGRLVSARRDGVIGYALSEESLKLLSEGDRRIFSFERARIEDGWVLAVFSVPEAERDRRHSLRVNLTRLGFGVVAPGVWIAPATIHAETKQALDRLGLAGYVDLFVGAYASDTSLSPEVQKWWDLSELSGLYEAFMSNFDGEYERAVSGVLTPLEAFQIYVPMLTQWRRLPYRDPGLPLELLPDGWKGEAARRLFSDLHEALAPVALTHVQHVLHPAHE